MSKGIPGLASGNTTPRRTVPASFLRSAGGIAYAATAGAPAFGVRGPALRLRSTASAHAVVLGVLAATASVALGEASAHAAQGAVESKTRDGTQSPAAGGGRNDRRGGPRQAIRVCPGVESRTLRPGGYGWDSSDAPGSRGSPREGEAAAPRGNGLEHTLATELREVVHGRYDAAAATGCITVEIVREAEAAAGRVPYDRATGRPTPVRATPLQTSEASAARVAGIRGTAGRPRIGQMTSDSRRPISASGGVPVPAPRTARAAVSPPGRPDNGVRASVPRDASAGKAPAVLERYTPALETRTVSVGADDDHGNEPGTATELALGEVVGGLLSPELDVDWFVVEIPRASDIVFEADSATFRLLDEGGEELARAERGFPDDIRRLRRGMSPGRYYLEVTGIREGGPWYKISAAEVVRIPDPALEAAVREELQMAADDDLTTIRMGTMRWLRAVDQGIEDITGLEHGIGLSELHLGSNEIRDLSPLGGLTALFGLWVGGNRVTDVSPLGGLAGLYVLDLSYNDITDVTALSGLPRVNVLNLAYNDLADVSGLAGLASLSVLDLARNRVSDVTPLAGLTSLQDLDLVGNRIADVTALAGPPQLRELRLSHNSIRDVSPLANLGELWLLEASDNEIREIAPLARLNSLLRLDVRRNPVNASAAGIAVALARRGVDVGVFDAHGDEQETATRLALGETVDGRLEPTFDEDYFRLEVSEYVDAVFFTVGEIDTAGAIFDAQGHRLAGGEFIAAYDPNFFFALPVGPGVYHLVVGGRGSKRYGATYALTARANEVDIPDEVLYDGLARAFRGPGLPIRMTDLVTVTSLGVSNLAVSDLSGLEFALRLEVLVANDNEIVDLSPLMRLRSLRFVDLRRNPLGEKAIRTQVPALAGRGVVVVTGDDHGDHPETATGLAPNGHAEGVIYPITERDYFRVVLPRPGDLALFTTGQSDTVGRVFGAAGELIAEIDDGADQSNFRFASSLAAGVYHLEVSARLSRYRTVPGAGAGYAPYVVRAEAALAPAPPPRAHVSAELDGSELVVVWNAFAGEEVTGYRVEVAAADGGAPSTCQATPDRRRCVFQDLTPGASYAVTVTALGGNGAPVMVTTLSEQAGAARSTWRGWRLELFRDLSEEQ